MTYCIQGIVPEKTNQVGFCNVKIRAGGKLVTAFNQTLEKALVSQTWARAPIL